MQISIRAFSILCMLLLVIPVLSHPQNSAAEDLGFTPLRYLSKAKLEEINNDTDWDELPVITNRREFFEYLNDCFEERMTVFPIAFHKKFKINAKTGKAFDDPALPMYVSNWCYQVIDNTSDDGIIKAVYQVIYYPGLNIADAYENGDTSTLTKDELKVYNKVLPIVKNARSIKNILDRELFIFNTITKSAKYLKIDWSKGLVAMRKISALGIFLDGTGNCQAFSDAFYMLGTMAGLDVGVMMSKAFGGGHAWNTIVIDGSAYFVDATASAHTFSQRNNKYLNHYYYFNAPREIMRSSHSWYKSYEPEPIEEDVDENYFYCTDLHYKNNRGKYGIYEESPEDALESVADGIVKNGWTIWYAMTSYDEYYATDNNSYKRLAQALKRRNWRGSARIIINVFSNKKLKYMYYTITLN